MDYVLDIAEMNRGILLKLANHFSLEQLNKVPDGFQNNLIWNIAHVMVTQQLLVYNLSGLPMMISDEMAAKYRKGTKVEGDVTQEEVDTIIGLMLSTIEKTREDYKNGLFKEYKAYTTSTNTTIGNVEEAMLFNNFHEGTHLGYVLALKKTL